MIDVGSIPLWTKVATSTGVQVFTGECELVRLVFPTARASTDSVAVYNSGGTNVGTFGTFQAKGSANFVQPTSIEVGAIFTTGIRIKMAVKTELVVVYRGRAA
jgi:hypothetical protein